MNHPVLRTPGISTKFSSTASRHTASEGATRSIEDLNQILVPQTYNRPGTATKNRDYLPNPKSCAQCGTTRTPQWREGPEGPKTLCNACGVKRVRQMRTASDSSKRRNTKSPSIAKQDSSDMPASEEYYEPKEHLPKRPLRKAAMKAAAKSAEVALRADWTGDAEEDSYHSSHDTGSATSADHNSDSAEEVAWVPQRHVRPCHMPPSPMAETVGHECLAAVNLLSMSVRDQIFPEARRPSLPRTTSNGAASNTLARTSTSSFTQVAGNGWSQPLPAAKQAQDPAQTQRSLGLLPEHKHREMLSAKEELDNTSREAAAADAAVAAVAKILAMKQAAAINARGQAAAAAKRVQIIMQDLDEQYGWTEDSQQPQSHKRQRMLQ